MIPGVPWSNALVCERPIIGPNQQVRLFCAHDKTFEISFVVALALVNRSSVGICSYPPGMASPQVE